MTVTTRPEEPGADEPFLRGLIVQNLALELHAHLWPEPVREQLLGIQYQGRRNTAPSAYPAGQSRIILADGVSVGWLYTAELEDAVYIAEILILAEFRGKGIGSEVLRDVIGAARQKVVRLTVNSLSAAAVRFYERLGFRRVWSDEVNMVMECRR
jgi:ribosomal protein S18 acetylase RimI-like enzyme